MVTFIMRRAHALHDVGDLVTFLSASRLRFPFQGLLAELIVRAVPIERRERARMPIARELIPTRAAEALSLAIDWRGRIDRRLTVDVVEVLTAAEHIAARIIVACHGNLLDLLMISAWYGRSPPTCLRTAWGSASTSGELPQSGCILPG